MQDITCTTAADIKRILVCQQRQIGDVLLATPALALLHERFPDAEIHVLTEKKCMPILEHNPHVHTIWAIDKNMLSSMGKALSWYRMVGKQGFDMVIDFQQLPRTRWVSFFADASIKLTFTPPILNRWVYSHWCKQLGGYSAHSKASILRLLGISEEAIRASRPQIFLSTDEKLAAQNMLTALGIGPEHKLIILDPTHKRDTRLWPARHYARLIDLAYEADASIRFLPCWGPGEEKDIQGIAVLCQHKEALVMTPTMLTLREMAACLAHATMHLGNCSAPRHMAVGVGTPSFVVHGSTGTEWKYPSAEHYFAAAGLPCQPCEKNTCSHKRCLEDFTAEQVYSLFAEHLAKHGRKAWS